MTFCVMNEWGKHDDVDGSGSVGGSSNSSSVVSGSGVKAGGVRVRW